MAEESSVPPPIRRTIDLGGLATEFLEWQPREPDAPLFIMLPGNPGSPLFYINYLSSLFAASRQRWRLFCVGHTGHSAATASHQAYGLQEQVAHKLAFVRWVQAQYPGRPIALAGHSIGAYCALALMRSLPSSAISRVVLLFPTVMNMQATPNGARLSPLFRLGRPLARWTISLLQALPAKLRQHVVTKVAALAGIHLEAVMTEAVEGLADSKVINNILFMASDEMETVRAFEKQSAHSALEDKMVFYFGHNDPWVNDTDVDVIAAAFSKATILRCREGHRHDFVVCPRSSERLAMATYGWLT